METSKYFHWITQFFANQDSCNRQLKSSLEAEVDLILPSSDDGTSYVLELLQQEGMSNSQI